MTQVHPLASPRNPDAPIWRREAPPMHCCGRLADGRLFTFAARHVQQARAEAERLGVEGVVCTSFRWDFARDRYQREQRFELGR